MAKTPPPAVTLDTTSPSFQTPDGAADAVSKDFAKQGNNEQAAVIFKRPDGTYGYSTVTPQDHDSFALRAQIPQGHSLAGIVHSHPGQDALAKMFSPDDLDVSDQLKVPSFIRFNADNSIRRYTPGTTKIQSTGPHGLGGLRTAMGDALAQEPPQAASSGGQAASSVPTSPLPVAADGTVRRDDSLTRHL